MFHQDRADACVEALTTGACAPDAPDYEAGEPCVEVIETATTATYHTCAPGLGCAVVGEELVCAERLAVGADCTTNPSSPCVEGSLCLADVGADTSSCQEVILARDEGDECTDFNEYEAGPITFCDATLGLYCGPAFTCVFGGLGALGDVCEIDSGSGGQGPARAGPAPPFQARAPGVSFAGGRRSANGSRSTPPGSTPMATQRSVFHTTRIVRSMGSARVAPVRREVLASTGAGTAPCGDPRCRYVRAGAAGRFTPTFLSWVWWRRPTHRPRARRAGRVRS